MRSLVLLLVCGFILGLGACRRETPQERHSGAAMQPAGQPAVWQIKLNQPQDTTPLAPDKPVTVTVTVNDPAGKPLADAQVTVSLIMKTMDMGENKSALSQTQPGVYEGKAIFTMAGPWEIEVHATKEGKTAIEKFPVTVK